MVKGNVDRHRIRVAVAIRLMKVEGGVSVAALLESPAGQVKLPHLVGSPGEMVVMVAALHPVDGQVRATFDRIVDRIVLDGESQILERPRSHPAATRKAPRAGHATAVVVVAFIPPVISDLVASVGVDKRVEHAANQDGVCGAGTWLGYEGLVSGHL